MSCNRIYEIVCVVGIKGPLIMIDLHIHTSHSDGFLSPAKVVYLARNKGLSAIAITDHDRVSGVDEAIFAGKGLGIEVIPGIEISAECNGQSVHILGLMIDVTNEGLANSLTLYYEAAETRIRLIINKISSLGHKSLSYDELVKFSRQIGSNNTCPLCLLYVALKYYLKFKGVVDSAGEAQRRFVKSSFIDEPMKKFTVCEAISIIHKAGGIAILAHPFGNTLFWGVSSEKRLDCQTLEYNVSAYKAMELDGMEAHYPAHTQEEFQFIVGLASKYQLLVSGGSDFHYGAHGGSIGEGCQNQIIPYTLLDKMKLARNAI